MKDDNCIFCKIIAGEIPSYTVYEDDDFKAIADVNPASKGHIIILPKEHAQNIFELEDEYCRKILPLAKKIAAALKKVYNPVGFNILQNNGKKAGQTVFHFHMHVIPRYEEDDIEMGWTPHDAVGLEEMAKKVSEEIQ